MAVQPVPDTPGLWRVPDWRRDMPGLYALIVGISAYPHLEDGSDPAPETFGLGQLGASASTAAALFDWLRQEFTLADLPLVWCQLLLAPGPDERAQLQARGLTHYAPASYLHLVQAIQRWTGLAPASPAAARASRTLFFFSGHGLQSNWRGLLLPSDYLDPGFGAPQLQNCIATRELQDWMEQCPVAEHLALLDACRNEFSPLAARAATAHGCFPALPPSQQAPRTAASLAATSPGRQAFQVPGQPHTLFGQAVLEALRGIAGGDSRLEFRELVDYVRPRVNALLREAGGNPLDQTVRPRVEGDDALLLTELAPAAPLPAPPPLAGAVRPGLRDARDPDEDRLEPTLRVDEPMALDALRRDFDAIHRRMGHEYVSHLWREGVSVLALEDGRPLDDALVLAAVARDAPSHLVQADVLLAPHAGGVLLVCEGAPYVQRERLAVALPCDAQHPVPVRLSLHFGAEDSAHGPRLRKLEARLGGPDAPEPYAALWPLLREAELGSPRRAARRADPDGWLEQAPLAACAALLLQARGGRRDALQDAPQRLWQRCPQLPDAAVLWAAALDHALQLGEARPFGLPDATATLAQALATLRSGAMPYFSASLDLLEGLLRRALRRPLDEAQRQPLLQAQQRLALLQEVAQPDGHFPVLAGLPRPAALPGEGALGTAEMRALLGHG